MRIISIAIFITCLFFGGKILNYRYECYANECPMTKNYTLQLQPFEQYNYTCAKLCANISYTSKCEQSIDFYENNRKISKCIRYKTNCENYKDVICYGYNYMYKNIEKNISCNYKFNDDINNKYNFTTFNEKFKNLSETLNATLIIYESYEMPISKCLTQNVKIKYRDQKDIKMSNMLFILSPTPLYLYIIHIIIIWSCKKITKRSIMMLLYEYEYVNVKISDPDFIHNWPFRTHYVNPENSNQLIEQIKRESTDSNIEKFNKKNKLSLDKILSIIKNLSPENITCIRFKSSYGEITVDKSINYAELSKLIYNDYIEKIKNNQQIYSSVYIKKKEYEQYIEYPFGLGYLLLLIICCKKIFSNNDDEQQNVNNVNDVNNISTYSSIQFVKMKNI